MQRSRRPSTIYKPSYVETEDESSGDVSVSDENEASTSEKSRKSRQTKKPETEAAKRFRMTKSEDEVFVKLCIEYFDKINDMSTIRGTPESSNVKLRNKIIQNAWEKITTTMNKSMKVSYFFVILNHTF